MKLLLPTELAEAICTHAQRGISPRVLWRVAGARRRGTALRGAGYPLSERAHRRAGAVASLSAPNRCYAWSVRLPAKGCSCWGFIILIPTTPPSPPSTTASTPCRGIPI